MNDCQHASACDHSRDAVADTDGRIPELRGSRDEQQPTRVQGVTGEQAHREQPRQTDPKWQCP